MSENYKLLKILMSEKDLININLKTKIEIDNSNLTPTKVVSIIKNHIKKYD